MFMYLKNDVDTTRLQRSGELELVEVLDHGISSQDLCVIAMEKVE